MKLGKMRHSIKIYQNTSKKNEVGDTIKEWVPVIYGLKAQKERLSARQTQVQEVEGIEYVYRFTVRYRRDITEDMKLECDDVIYDIIHVNNIIEIDRCETVIDCVYRKSGVEHG